MSELLKCAICGSEDGTVDSEVGICNTCGQLGYAGPEEEFEGITSPEDYFSDIEDKSEVKINLRISVETFEDIKDSIRGYLEDESWADKLPDHITVTTQGKFDRLEAQHWRLRNFLEKLDDFSEGQLEEGVTLNEQDVSEG